jgi:hypothetical protein
MPFIFKSIHTRLHTGNEPGKRLMIEPIMCLGIDADGWHALGVYQIHDDSGVIGRMIFEGKQWQFEGTLLSEIEQEELAYLIRFHDGAAA